MRKQPFTYAKFKQIYSEVPRLCVDLVIQTGEGILLTKREMEPYKGYWHLPGGTVLFQEKILDTIQRIAQEEVGIQVIILGLGGFIEFLQEKRDNKLFHSVSLGVVCEPKDAAKIKLSKTVRLFKDSPKHTIPEQKKFLEEFFLGCDDPDCEEHTGHKS